jgi:hypothetical protein
MKDLKFIYYLFLSYHSATFQQYLGYADGSFLISAHQNGLIKFRAWMGEDPGLNARHRKILQEQSDK